MRVWLTYRGRMNVTRLTDLDVYRKQPVKAEKKPIPAPNAMPGLTLSLLMGGRAPRAKLQPAS